MNKKLVIVDGSSYFYRAYFAIRGLATKEGFPTNAIYGFVQMIRKVLKELKPDYFAIAFDSKGPTFREEKFKEYKAQRPEMPDDLMIQLPYIKEIVDAYNIPRLEMEGYEADDIIGTLVEKFRGKVDIIIISGDKDLFQLVGKGVVVYDTMREIKYDEDGVVRKLGVPPEKVVDYLALVGDTSDNIPGIPGIGPKTAVKILSQFNSVEDLFKNLDKLPKKLREKLEKHQDLVFLSKDLATIRRDLPLEVSLEDLKIKEPNYEKLRKIFKKLEFNSLLKELPPEVSIDHSGYLNVQDGEILKKVFEVIKRSKEISFDTETTDLQPMLADLVGLSIAWDKGKAAYFPVGHKGGANLDRKTLEEYLKEVFEDEAVKKIGHNIKFDYLVFLNQGWGIKGIYFDTLVASYLINPQKKSHTLDALSQEYLDHTPISYKEALKGARNLSLVDADKVSTYCCEDADIALRLKEKLSEEIKKEDMEYLFYEVEMPLVEVLTYMEFWGVKVDVEKLKELSQEFSKKLKEITEKIYELAGMSFNIASSKQLAHVLFEKLKLPPVKKTKTGYSTDSEVLESLLPVHPIISYILQFRTYSKLKSTYIDSLPQLINPKTGRIHTSYNQTVTATGRLSSSNPNLQNIPIRGEEGSRIREAFVPEDGYLFLSADYSQIELRILAHLSGDEKLIEAFKRGEDIHTRTALEVFGDVNPELRRKAKTINFGIIYGMTPYGLSKQLGIEPKEAKRYIESYFAKYPKVKEFLDRTVKEAEERGFVRTMLGRKRYIPELRSKNRNVKQLGVRTALNTPIQGSAADLIKVAMVNLFRRMRRDYPRVKMIIQVHDELVFEVPEEEVEEFKKVCKEIMERAMELKVPLEVELGVGRNWKEAHG